MRLGVDIDNVLADFYGPIAKWLNEEFNVHITSEAIDTWHFYRKFKISDEAYFDSLMRFSEEGEFGNLEPINGAKDALLILSNQAEIYFITSRPESARNSTICWFAKYFPAVDLNHIFITPRKGELAQQLDLTHFVDDKPENCEEVFNAGVENVYLYCAQTNRAYKEYPEIVRVCRWINSFGISPWCITQCDEENPSLLSILLEELEIERETG